MRTLRLSLLLILLSQLDITAQTDFIIEPSQSMIMTGKGAGQDATINPFYGKECVAIVENIGERKFSIRIQKKGKIINEISLSKGKLIKIKLLKNYELYLDPNPNGIAKARIDYQKIN